MQTWTDTSYLQHCILEGHDIRMFYTLWFTDEALKGSFDHVNILADLVSR